MGFADEGNACTFVEHPQGGGLRPCKPAEQQESCWQQGPTQLCGKSPQWLLQDIRDYQIEPRTPMIRRFTAELDIYSVRIQCRVCLGAGQRKWIDVGCNDELSASCSGDSGKHSCARTDVQHCFRLPLPAEEVHRTGAEARRRMRTVPKHRRACNALRKLGQGQDRIRHVYRAG